MAWSILHKETHKNRPSEERDISVSVICCVSLPHQHLMGWSLQRLPAGAADGQIKHPVCFFPVSAVCVGNTNASWLPPHVLLLMSQKPAGLIH